MPFRLRLHTDPRFYISRDGGWIRTLLEEAENERMHLLTFMKVCVFLFSLPYRLDF